MTKSQQIKSRLKEELGYNQRYVSVKDRPGGLSWSFIFTIRSPDVDYKKITEFAKSCESIDRCEASGEILGGGNTYTRIDLSDKVAEEWKSKWLWLVEELKADIRDQQQIGRYIFQMYHGGIGFEVIDTANNMHWPTIYDHRFRGHLAMDLYFNDQLNPLPE